MKKWIILLLGIIISGILWLSPMKICEESMMLYIDISSEVEQAYQVFYSKDDNLIEEQSKRIKYSSVGKVEKLEIELPKETRVIRVDFGEQAGKHTISKFVLMYGKQVIFNSIYLKEYIVTENMISFYKWNKEELEISTNGSDSFLTLDLSTLNLEDRLKELDEVNRRSENIKK